MSCEYKLEDFCTLEHYTGLKYKCKFAEGESKLCIAKPEDLIEICPDCDQSSEDCVCGTLGW